MNLGGYAMVATNGRFREGCLSSLRRSESGWWWMIILKIQLYFNILKQLGLKAFVFFFELINDNEVFLIMRFF
jgi:hypothetical protein